MNYLTIIIHLEPPVAHGQSSRDNFFPEEYKIFFWSEILFDIYCSVMGGSITAITGWPNCGDHQLAPLL
jgi:hypothetical protein